MTGNEIVQWTIVAAIVLAALVWAGIKMARMGRRKNSGCNCCSSASDCKIKELKNQIEERGINALHERQNCHDGQSAKS